MSDDGGIEARHGVTVVGCLVSGEGAGRWWL